VYHNPLALRQAAHPEKFVGREVKEAKPVRKTDIRESCYMINDVILPRLTLSS